MAIIASFAHVEVQEVNGDSFSKVAEGKLDVLSSTDKETPAFLSVDGLQVPFLKNARPHGAYRKLDSKTFIFSTSDLMSCYYITFAKDSNADDLETAEYVFSQLAQGLDPTPKPKPTPAAAAAAAPAAAAAAAAAAPAAQKPQPNNPFGQLGGMLQGMAQRAQQDTAMLGEIAQKAAADTMLVAAQGAKAVQNAMNNGNAKPA